MGDNHLQHQSTQSSIFDVQFVIDRFVACNLIADDDINLPDYISAYRELNKMFSSFGTLFSFVEHDIAEKENILQTLHDSNSNDYQTVRRMIATECSNGTTPSNIGCRTLLRLHRALGFIIEFVRQLHASDANDRMSRVCRHAYDQTLAIHHPWLVRKGVHLAVYMLPNRNQLLKQLSGSTDTVDEEVAATTLMGIVKAATVVYDRVQILYASSNLLHLP